MIEYPNLTVFIQLANFIFLLLVLNLVLYRPIRNILGQRKDEVHTYESTIKTFNIRLNQSEKRLDENKKEARGEGIKEKETLKGEGLEEEKRLIQEALSTSVEKIGTARKDLESNIAGIHETLHGEIEGLSKELAEKMIGRGL